MKILIVVRNTGIGGVTASAVNFSNELVSRGHRVHFLDMSGDNKCKDRLSDDVEMLSLIGKSRLWNIGVADVRNTCGIKKLGVLALGVIKKLTIRSGLWFQLVFSKFNKNETYDVAIAFRQCAPCYSFVLNKVNAKKKIGFVHGELRFMGDISSWKKYMTRFDKIAYVSNAVREEFVSVYPELEANAFTVYNMFDIEQIKKLSAEKCDVEFDKNNVNIVTVARIDNAFKQIDWIVKICDMLKKRTDTPFHWYVLGDGPNFKEIIALMYEYKVEDVLTFVGTQTNPYAFVKQCDFTVLTSRSESYGMVVVESIILQKPVVATRYPAIHEIMTDGKEGVIVDQNIEAVCESVLDFIENKDNIRTKLTENLSNNQSNNDISYNQFIDAVS